MSYTLVPKNKAAKEFHVNVINFGAILDTASKLCPAEFQETEIKPPDDAPIDWLETMTAKTRWCPTCREAPCQEEHTLWLLQERQQVDAKDACRLGIALSDKADSEEAADKLIAYWIDVTDNLPMPPEGKKRTRSALRAKLIEFACFLQESDGFDIRF